jgi:hypothetical protein
VTDADGSELTVTPIRVLFLIERPEGWLNVDRLFAVMQADARFGPEILVVPPANVGALERDRQSARCVEVCRSRGLEPRLWGDGDRLEPDRFDCAIFNTPYDRNRPPELYFDVVARSVRRTVYVPYGLVTGDGEANRRFQYAQPTQRRADLVVARSEAERSAYRRFCPSGASHVFVSGLPRLDSLFDIERFPADPELVAAVAGRKAFLWSSHFSFLPRFVGESYSTFDRVGPALFRFAAARPDVALVWRPHPQLFDRMIADGAMDAEELAALKRELGELGVILDERPDHRHAFAVSHALMADAGSFLFEYLATGKPVLFLCNPNGEPLNEEASALVRSYDVAETAREAVAFIERLLRDGDLRRDERCRIRSTFLPHWDGRASERVAQRIVELCAPDDAGVAIDAERFPRTVQLIATLEEIRARKGSLVGRAVGRTKATVKEWIRPRLTEHPALLAGVSRAASWLRAGKPRER